jgi:peptidoglycan/xylan/chitin deacetylase (PgdA/CDA1 family)
VLTYHAVAERPGQLDDWPPGARLYVFTIDELRRQLDHLAAERFTAISLAHLVRWRQGEAELPERPIVLSFDDGHKSNAELAVPALRERGQRAIFFVTAGRVGTGEAASWPQLKAMLSQGMEIGSHTLTHPNPSTLSPAELEHELAESKRVLGDGLGASVDFVASPTGYDSRHFAGLARKVGYKAALQGVIGRNRRSTDLFALRRFVLKRSHDLETFRRLVDPSSRAYVPLRVRQVARNVARRLLGVRGYEAVRAAFLGRGNGQAKG